jgi:hypothetical protein
LFFQLVRDVGRGGEANRWICELVELRLQATRVEMEKKPVHARERMREIYYSHRLMELVRDLSKIGCFYILLSV